MGWPGLPHVLYQMKSATDQNRLLQIAETGSSTEKQGLERETRELAQDPARPVPGPSPPTFPTPLSCSHHLQPYPPLSRALACKAERGYRSHQGQHSHIFQPAPNTSRDENFAAFPRNQLHCAFYPAETCLFQPSPRAHQGLFLP